MKGSPASFYSVSSGFAITQVNDTMVGSVEEFLTVIVNLPDGSYVRLHTVSSNNISEVKVLKTNVTYWPTQIFRRNLDGTWNYELKHY